jgi:hypothetical protein
VPVAIKLGRKPAVADPRVPFLAKLTAAKELPTPPLVSDWYAAVDGWGMLGNDAVGDCVEACIGHATLVFTSYAGEVRQPTTDEAIALYSAITGYKADDPATDNGTVILGPGGAMEYWIRTGVTFGGAESKATAYARVSIASDCLWIRQAIEIFGGVMLGIILPQNVVADTTVPFVWDDPSGPVAGGHCVWLCGYDFSGSSPWFDLVSWGQRYRMTQKFLEGTFEEAVAIYDPDSLNARGVTGADFDPEQLLGFMQTIRAKGLGPKGA